MHPAPTIVVVMPAFNEASVIGAVLSKIPSHINSFEAVALVVDDGSTDSTREIARSAGARVLRHVANLVSGAATIPGLRAARRLDADIVVTMDADGQHDPAEIEKLVRCLV